MPNAKCDAIGRDSDVSHVESTTTRPRPSKIFTKCLTPDDLLAFNEKCKDEAFVDTIIDELGQVYEMNTCTGNGRTVALNLIDRS